MKPFQGGTSDSKSSSTLPPPKETSIPSDPPPAYTPNPDFPTPSSSGDSKPLPNNTSVSNVPSNVATSSFRTNQDAPPPTPQPVPGRPLLHDGQCLVYQEGVYCHKCGNTGYKNDDPYHPCKSCWKKYGRPYTSAIAQSWGSTTFPPSSPSDSKHPPTNQPRPRPPAQNYQRPLLLTNFHSSPAAPYTGIVMNHSYMRPGLIERGGQQNRVRPPQFQPIPPPPPSLPISGTGVRNEKQGYGHGYVQSSNLPPLVQMQPGVANGYAAQQGVLHSMPGDPRIGGT